MNGEIRINGGGEGMKKNNVIPRKFYRITCKKQKGREGPLKWQGWREAKKTDKNTSGAGYTACAVFFVILYNGKIV